MYADSVISCSQEGKTAYGVCKTEEMKSLLLQVRVLRRTLCYDSVYVCICYLHVCKVLALVCSCMLLFVDVSCVGYLCLTGVALICGQDYYHRSTVTRTTPPPPPPAVSVPLVATAENAVVAVSEGATGDASDAL